MSYKQGSLGRQFDSKDMIISRLKEELGERRESEEDLRELSKQLKSLEQRYDQVVREKQTAEKERLGLEENERKRIMNYKQ